MLAKDGAVQLLLTLRRAPASVAYRDQLDPQAEAGGRLQVLELPSSALAPSSCLSARAEGPELREDLLGAVLWESGLVLLCAGLA